MTPAKFRIFSAYVSFIIAAISVAVLHDKPEDFTATCVAIAFFALNMLFFLLRNLTSAEIDLDDRQISLKNQPDTNAAKKDENKAERDAKKVDRR